MTRTQAATLHPPVACPLWGKRGGIRVAFLVKPAKGILSAPEMSAISALNGSNGLLQWRYQTQGHGSFVLAVMNQVAYAISIMSSADGATIQGSVLLALNASNGRLLWHYDLLNAGFESPIVG